MRILVNAGHGQLFSAADLLWIESHNLAGVRQDIHWDLSLSRELVRQFRSDETSLAPLFLLSADLSATELVAVAEEVSRWCVDFGIDEKRPWIELVNEPNYRNGEPWRNRWGREPREFGKACVSAARAINAVSERIQCIVGGIGKTDRPGLRYLEQLMEAVGRDKQDLLEIGYHSYRMDQAEPNVPHEGFRTRDEETAALKALAPGYILTHTEGGYWRGVVFRRTWWGGRDFVRAVCDDDVRRNLLEEIRYNRDVVGASAFVIYQLHDGPQRDLPDDNFGLIHREGYDTRFAEILRDGAI